MKSSLRYALLMTLLVGSRVIAQEESQFTIKGGCHPTKVIIAHSAEKTWNRIKIIAYAVETFCAAFFFIYLQVFDDDPYTCDMIQEFGSCRLRHATVKLMGHITFLGAFLHGSIGFITTAYPLIKEKIKKKLDKENVNQA